MQRLNLTKECVKIIKYIDLLNSVDYYIKDAIQIINNPKYYTDVEFSEGRIKTLKAVKERVIKRINDLTVNLKERL